MIVLGILLIAIGLIIELAAHHQIGRVLTLIGAVILIVGLVLYIGDTSATTLAP